ncbi:MAG: energy-coupling factor ABC transporter permease [Gammaproteobacteria bacterium]|nr:energy-coupling factor ABC transporter permease [Gammaproteobacteria bacterium]
MHIEPGILNQLKVMLANGALLGVLTPYLRQFVSNPTLWVRTAIAAIFFSLFMQSFHIAVGPSELHFVGAMPIYLLLGFLPTVFGFVAGLLLQGLIFEPWDLAHLAVNSLSLIVPLAALHYTQGRTLFTQNALQRARVPQVLRLDALYYSGVTVMVGFWLAVSEVSTPFSAWASFAASYVAVVMIEPVFTYVTVRALQTQRHRAWVQRWFALTPVAN